MIKGFGNKVKLYPNIISTKGYNRSTLIDLLYGNMYLVPNSLIDYLESNDRSLSIEFAISDTEREVLTEYKEFILGKELGIEVPDEIGVNLKEISTKYYPYSKLTNSILELDSNSTWDFLKAIQELDSCGTQFIEIRFLDYKSFTDNFLKIKKSVESSTVESIHMLIPFNEGLQDFMETSLSDFLRLYKVTIYNSKKGFELENGFKNIIFSSQEKITHDNCGNVSTDNFTISTSSYVKNRNFNSCLSHKLSINKDGMICNCPSLDSNYGSIDSEKIIDILNDTDFQSSWEVTKDQISVCSMCEFRWVCTDCRAFTDKNSELGKPSKCGYNPFISLWSDEENYLSEKECGIVFDNNKISIDEKLLENINRNIWG